MLVIAKVQLYFSRFLMLRSISKRIDGLYQSSEILPDSELSIRSARRAKSYYKHEKDTSSSLPRAKERESQCHKRFLLSRVFLIPRSLFAGLSGQCEKAKRTSIRISTRREIRNYKYLFAFTTEYMRVSFTTKM